MSGRISDPVKGIFGAGAHSDFGFITLLATDDNYGLQVLIWLEFELYPFYIWWKRCCNHLYLLQICKDKDAKPQQWEFVAPLKGLVNRIQRFVS